MDKKFVIGVDLDGVVGDYFGAIRRPAAKWLGVDESTLPKEIDYDFKSWNSDQWPGGFIAMHRYAVVQEKLFSIMPPIKDAAQVLRKLSQDDFRIRIITSRLCMKFHHETAVQQTVEWLERYDIPYWDLCFVADKTAVNADMYIDDSPKNFKELETAQKNVWLFRQGWNQHIQSPFTVKNWHEIYDIAHKGRGV